VPAPADAFGGLPSRRIDAAFAGGVVGQRRIRIRNPGGLAAADGSLDPEKLHDVVIVLEYGLPSAP